MRLWYIYKLVSYRAGTAGEQEDQAEHDIEWVKNKPQPELDENPSAIKNQMKMSVNKLHACPVRWGTMKISILFVLHFFNSTSKKHTHTKN